ncbi:phosphoribosylamine--glycine ligase [Verrucomicrobia bacterium SCGC AG-212-E04]|nr:phosphoribosylamine--glycine ligase [Verrucomicrobia bacterium SCGC AG-212-E04]
MNVLVLGSGGREHALAWKLARSPRVKKVFCAPGNAGIAELGENVPIAITDHDGLLAAARAHRIDLTVVGPDDALAAGIVDKFSAAGHRIFGPSRAAAELEWSKAFAKDFMRRHGIPTAAAREFHDFSEARNYCRASSRWPLVVKADGLATGKGVMIAEDFAAAEAALRAMMEEAKFGAAGRRVVVEECLEGPECSLHALVDGTSALLMPMAQDHKRLLDGDLGPNTGGMGTASPPTRAPRAGFEDEVRRTILDPFLAGLSADNLPFRGMLFPGLMLTGDGPKVLEFNARFGDPETQVLLPRLRSDLLPLLEATIDGQLAGEQPEWDSRAAVCVILASQGYPEKPIVGRAIEGLDALRGSDDIIVFHAGTRHEPDGRIVTSGGRVLGVTALGDTLAAARDRAYEAAARIRFEGMQFRRDLAAGA